MMYLDIILKKAIGGKSYRMKKAIRGISFDVPSYFKSRFVEQRPHHRPKTVITDLVFLLVYSQQAESEKGVDMFLRKLFIKLLSGWYYSNLALSISNEA
mmetsp:Transcript_996/g.1177  ORF Transcript_996/g.1177 Transcript_996/m.1177 type:complete len:99 (-) Transcript_996:80-376(-)